MLDHILLTDLKRLVNAEEVRVNSVFPESEAASDHDILVAAFDVKK